MLALRLLILSPEATNPNQSQDNLSPHLPAAVLHVRRSFPRQSAANTSLHPSAPFHLSVSISCVLMRPGTGGGDLTFKSQASPLQWGGGKKREEKKVQIEESDRAERTKNIHGHLALRSGEFYFSWCVMPLYNISVRLLMYVCVFWWVQADYTIARVMVSAATLPSFYRCGQISPGGASPVR